MKKILKGCMYNTETAKMLACSEHGQIGSFGYFAEELYLTKSGKYFIHGEGGAKTQYAKPDGDGMWMSGEAIRPISEDSAKEWAESELSGDEYERVFGEVSDEVARLAMNVRPDIKERFDTEKKSRNLTGAEFIEYMLDKL